MKLLVLAACSLLLGTLGVSGASANSHDRTHQAAASPANADSDLWRTMTETTPASPVQSPRIDPSASIALQCSLIRDRQSCLANRACRWVDGACVDE